MPRVLFPGLSLLALSLLVLAPLSITERSPLSPTATAPSMSVENEVKEPTTLQAYQAKQIPILWD